MAGNRQPYLSAFHRTVPLPNQRRISEAELFDRGNAVTRARLSRSRELLPEGRALRLLSKEVQSQARQPGAVPKAHPFTAHLTTLPDL
jgi:hypothetical protein